MSAMRALVYAAVLSFALVPGASAIAGKVRPSDASLDVEDASTSRRGLDLIEMLQGVSLDKLHREEAASEKRTTAPDCAEEVLMRQLFTESFYGRNYDACVADLMVKWFEPGGKAEELMGPPENLDHEEVIEKLRRKCITKQGHGAALGPRLVRMTFHDASDYNNSMLPNGTEIPYSETGVDGCLRTALLSVGLTQQADDDDLDEIAKGDPNHNRGLNNAVRWTLHMATITGMARPDVQVLGAVTALESWFDGPEMGFKFGRETGQCSKVVCMNEDCWDNETPFFKQPVAEPVGPGFFCPMTNTLEPLRQVLGLSLDELVALQGAHSVGGVIVCSGLGNVASGPYCPTNCGIPPGDFFENGNLDGTSFDDTPGKLDNRYYQLLMNEDYEDLPACATVASKFPHLNQNGLSRETRNCSAGLVYEPENACEVEACVDTCEKTQDCIQAENTETEDTDAFDLAWDSCLTCKRMCSSSHRKKEAFAARKAHIEQCGATCNTTSAPCINYQNLAAQNFDFELCKGACDGAKDTCKAACDSERSDVCAPACNSAFSACDQVCIDNRTACRANCTDSACRQACNQQRWRVCRPACGATKQACNQNCWGVRGNCTGACFATRSTCMGACWDQRGALNQAERECRGCKWRVCVPEAEAIYQSMYNESSLTVHPARWCKRLKDVKQCLDPNFTVAVNGGWGDCPEDKRATFPNTGQGRLTIVQNLERWTTFRGLNKRIMVLPSDWSYLGKADTKTLFQTYGTNEALWKSMFVQAFTKVSEMGASPGQLQQCTAVSCTTSGFNISCPLATGSGATSGWHFTKMQEARNESGLPPFVRPTTLEYDASSTCTPAAASPPTGCSVVGGYGMKAKIECSGYSALCLTAGGVAMEAIIANEWATSGGQQPTCNHTIPPTMLSTDASHTVRVKAKRFRGSRKGAVDDESSLLQGSMEIMGSDDDFELEMPDDEL